jgi:hypothetical protein
MLRFGARDARASRDARAEIFTALFAPNADQGQRWVDDPLAGDVGQVRSRSGTAARDDLP